MSDNNYPMPGNVDFSAEEERAMRAGGAATLMEGASLGALTPRKAPASSLTNLLLRGGGAPTPPDDATDEQ